MLTLIWFLIMKYGFNYPYTLDQISDILFCCILWIALELFGIFIYISLSKE